MEISTSLHVLTTTPSGQKLFTQEARSVADFLYDLVIIHSCPSIIMSDQGREFVNKVILNLCEKLHIDQRISSAYHPQTNGLDERFNQTHWFGHCRRWSRQKKNGICVSRLFCLAYRTSQQASSKYTPFELLYGVFRLRWRPHPRLKMKQLKASEE